MTGTMAKIEDLADVQIGYHFRGGVEPEAEGTHQLVQIKDIGDDERHGLRLEDLERVSLDRDPGKAILQNGDVLFVSKGRRNFATLVEGLSPEMPQTVATGSLFIARVERTEDILPGYLAWYINQGAAQNYLERLARGSSVPFISKSVFASLPVAVPPLEVQERIVSLHRLSMEENRLLQELRRKREQLIQSACMRAVNQENRGE